ncbi:phospholipid ABC transporter ATP-binding protein MlaF, partial [Francisella tularensis subsp. holarctica]|nr:phospholipid ABC transporter ATP-binding protein MlaF [Francisella tularensis subsp. holarctica]
HDIQESLSISDHIIIVVNKKIIDSDSPENIKNSKDQQIQNFLAGKPLYYNYHNQNDLEKNLLKKEIIGS